MIQYVGIVPAEAVVIPHVIIVKNAMMVIDIYLLGVRGGRIKNDREGSD